MPTFQLVAVGGRALHFQGAGGSPNLPLSSKQPTRIGRAPDNDVRLPADWVQISSRHCVVTYSPEQVRDANCCPCCCMDSLYPTTFHCMQTRFEVCGIKLTLLFHAYEALNSSFYGPSPCAPTPLCPPPTGHGRPLHPFQHPHAAFPGLPRCRTRGWCGTCPPTAPL
jgi:hypothetical protein